MKREICEKCEVTKRRMFSTKDEETGEEFLRVLAGDGFTTKANIPSYVDKAEYLKFYGVFLDSKLSQALKMDECEMIWKEGKTFMFKDRRVNGLHVGKEGEWKFGDAVPLKDDSRGCPYYAEHLMHKLNEDGE